MFGALSALALGCIPSKSQLGEESHMKNFMPTGRSGTFVEIGALDGHVFSNTRVLNKCHGWPLLSAPTEILTSDLRTEGPPTFEEITVPTIPSSLHQATSWRH